MSLENSGNYNNPNNFVEMGNSVQNSFDDSPMNFNNRMTSNDNTEGVIFEAADRNSVGIGSDMFVEN